MKKLLIASMSVAVIALGGCSHTVETGNTALATETYESLSSSIVKGKTTKQELLQRFGQPTNRSNNPIDGSEIWSWIYSGSMSKSDGRAFIPVVGGFFAGNAKGSTKHIMLGVTFEDDVVSSVNIQDTNSGSNWNRSTSANK